MKKERQKDLWTAIGLLVAFVLWTVSLRFVDVQAVGPQSSTVGWATINRFVHELTGVHLSLYVITDWLGLVPIGVAFGFAVFGLVQWFVRKHIRAVDRGILALGGFYLAVMAVYALFEVLMVNYRPVLIDGALEASYPSSTTMLVLCVMPTALMQFRTRIQNRLFKGWGTFAITAFIAFMVLGRLVSGVHWFTDIVGGALLSAGLVLLYRFFSRPVCK